MNFILKKINTLKFAKFAIFVFFIIINISSIILIMNNLFVISSVFFMIISILFLTISWFSLSNFSKQISSINDLAKNCANGILYHRATHIDETQEIGILAWNINNMLDQFEAFSRDMDASLKVVTSGKSHRKMLPSGLHGDFVRLSKNINKALEICLDM